MPQKAPTFSDIMFMLFLLAGWACMALYAICSFFFINIHSPIADWEIALLKIGMMFLSGAFFAYSLSGGNREISAIRLLISVTLAVLTCFLDPFFLIICALVLMTVAFTV